MSHHLREYITNPCRIPNSTIVTSWARSHGPIERQPRSSRAQRLWVENARPNHCCNIHPGWSAKFCEQKWPYLVDIWVIPGKGWEFSPKRNPSKKSRILTVWSIHQLKPGSGHHVYRVYQLKRAWWKTLWFCWSICPFLMPVNSFHKMGVFCCLFCCQLIKKVSLVNHQVSPVIPMSSQSCHPYVLRRSLWTKSAICNFGCPSSYSPLLWR